MEQSLDKTRVELCGLREASQFTDLSESYLRRHSVGGLQPRIPYLKLGGKIKFRVADLMDMMR